MVPIRMGIGVGPILSKNASRRKSDALCRLIVAAALVVGIPSLALADVGLFYRKGVPQVEFAAAEIQAALKGKGNNASKELDELAGAKEDLRIVIAGSAEETKQLVSSLGVGDIKKDSTPQSYAVRSKAVGTGRIVAVLAHDPMGAMYGGIDIAEAITLGTLADIKDEDHSPYIARRGIKFNIPLDARTPSYSDAGDAAQKNIPEMWSLDFWHEFLDEMARRRFNVLSLWNLHPFPSLVRVPDYPDVALADVMRTTVPFDSSYALTGRDMVRPAQLAHLEVLKKMTIEQKIDFWRAVMDYAHDRGIEVYLFSWNIFVWGADGKYGITSDQTNPITIDYFRKSIRQTLLTYPRLAGLGVTAGENMQNLTGEFSKENWLIKTYGQAILDVKKLQPDRSIPLIHRLNQVSVKNVWADWKDYPGDFSFSYKYSIAHMYSSPHPPFAKKDLAELPSNLRSWMTVRNDDLYHFRWGDPDYAREYIRGLPGAEILAGYYMGPDGYVWGREFTSTEPQTPRQLFTKKNWYSFMMWGRLGYEPSLPDALFQRTLDVRFPEAPAGKLFAASMAASKIIPQITRFFWSGNDLAWFPEACISHPSHRGFYSVKDFVNGTPMPGSGILSIRQYRDALSQGKPINGTTPGDVAAALQRDAAEALKLTGEMPDTIADKELRLTIGDLKSMALLGNYYAEKILGAIDLASFDTGGKPEQQASAIKHLEAAVLDWQQYADVATHQDNPELLTRVGFVDLNALTAKVRQDVRIASDWKPAR